MDAPLPLVDIVNQLSEDINGKKGTQFFADTDSVPTAESTIRNFFGNILLKYKRLSFLYTILGFLFEDVPGDGVLVKRKNDNSKPSGKAYYVIEKDAGFFMKTFVSVGAFLSFSWGFTVATKSFGFSFRVPWFDFRVPTLGAYYYVREAIGGGLSEILDTREFFPLGPFFDVIPGLNEYGDSYTNAQSDNIQNSRINRYLDVEGYNLADGNITKWDYDSNNTYAIVHAKKKKQELSIYEILLSFETPFDNEYRFHYRNRNGADVLKQLALVSNRWFYVDPNNKIHFLPRNDMEATIELNTDNLLEFDRKTEKEPDSKISVDRYEADKDGKVQKYGIVLRKNELDSIVNQYSKFFEGTRNEFKIKAYNPPSGVNKIKLMDEIIITDYQHENSSVISPQSVGRVTEIKQSFLENWIELKTEVSSNFELSTFDGTQDEGEGPNPLDPGVVLVNPEPFQVFTWHGSINITWNYTGEWGVNAENVDIWLMQETYPDSGAYQNVVLITSISTTSSSYEVDLTGTIFLTVPTSVSDNYKIRFVINELGILVDKNILIYPIEV